MSNEKRKVTGEVRHECRNEPVESIRGNLVMHVSEFFVGFETGDPIKYLFCHESAEARTVQAEQVVAAIKKQAGVLHSQGSMRRVINEALGAKHDPLESENYE